MYFVSCWLRCSRLGHKLVCGASLFPVSSVACRNIKPIHGSTFTCVLVFSTHSTPPSPSDAWGVCLRTCLFFVDTVLNACLFQDPYPYPSLRPRFAALIKHFGSQRLLWGSDFPFVSDGQCGWARNTLCRFRRYLNLRCTQPRFMSGAPSCVLIFFVVFTNRTNTVCVVHQYCM